MRFKSGLIIGVFGLVVVILGDFYFAIGITVLTYFALLELFRMAEFTGIKPATKTTLFSCFILIISTYLELKGIIGEEISNAILPISSIGICTWLLLQPKPGKISDIATSIFGLFYLGFLPSYWIRLRELDSIFIGSNYQGNGFSELGYLSGFNITLISCLIIVSSDIGSYLIGKRYGKSSLSLISPGKTIEGLIDIIKSEEMERSQEYAWPTVDPEVSKLSNIEDIVKFLGLEYLLDIDPDEPVYRMHRTTSHEKDYSDVKYDKGSLSWKKEIKGITLPKKVKLA